MSNIICMKTTILVTGGAGYIGPHTTNALIESGFDVVIIDDLSTGFESLIHPKAKFYQANVLDTVAVAEILSKENISGVIHFAAKIIVPESIAKPLEYYQNNTMGTLSMLLACKQANVTNFVFSSTAVVYKGTSLEPLSEDLPLGATSPYGSTKIFSEQMIRDCEIEFGLRSIILRYFNVAGASESLEFGQLSKNATHLIKIASKVACGKRESISITGTDYPTPDGTGVRDYIHVEDLADAHVLAMKYLLNGGKSEILNCGYGHGASVREVIDTMKKVTGVDFKVLECERRPGDVACLVANNEKIKQILGWIPKKDNLELICKSAFDWEKKFH